MRQERVEDSHDREYLTGKRRSTRREERPRSSPSLPEPSPSKYSSRRHRSDMTEPASAADQDLRPRRHSLEMNGLATKRKSRYEESNGFEPDVRRNRSKRSRSPSENEESVGTWLNAAEKRNLSPTPKRSCSRLSSRSPPSGRHSGNKERHGRISELREMDDDRDHKRRRSEFGRHERKRSTEPADENEKFTLFFTKRFPFSNHFPCDKLVIDGINFTCTEQYYMYMKALTFGDKRAAKDILATTDPKEMKGIGSRIKNFSQDVWDAPSRSTMVVASISKYKQNRHLRTALFATHGTTLVEANPSDVRWGIGLSMDDPRSQCRNSWRGKNWLGDILTKVREALWQDPEYKDEVRHVKKRQHRRTM